MLGNLLKRLSGTKSDDLTYPRLPLGITVYVIGDIHGCLDPLSRTLKAIDTDIERTRPHYSAEIYLGDYADRGPDSAGVLECLIQRQKIRRMIFIKGNHDDMFEHAPSLIGFPMVVAKRSDPMALQRNRSPQILKKFLT